MRLVFTEGATPAERLAVCDALRRVGVDFAETAGALDLARAPEDALAFAAMPGVAAIEPAPASAGTVREAVLTWVAGAATVMGVLSIAAANVPATLGAPADPLRTPSPLRPSWPLLPWDTAVAHAPAWLAGLVFAAAAAVLFFWPDLAGPLAAKRPLLHTLAGVAALASAAGLLALGMAP